MHAYNIKESFVSGVSLVLTILIFNSSSLSITFENNNYIELIILILIFFGFRGVCFHLIDFYRWYNGK